MRSLKLKEKVYKDATRVRQGKALLCRGRGRNRYAQLAGAHDVNAILDDVLVALGDLSSARHNTQAGRAAVRRGSGDGGGRRRGRSRG